MPTLTDDQALALIRTQGQLDARSEPIFKPTDSADEILAAVNDQAERERCQAVGHASSQARDVTFTFRGEPLRSMLALDPGSPRGATVHVVKVRAPSPTDAAVRWGLTAVGLGAETEMTLWRGQVEAARSQAHVPGLKRIASAMRPELAAAMARQEQAEKPRQSVTCPTCDGAGTELLFSSCPQCKGIGSLPRAADDRRFSYELRETFRGGDQVWEIKYGDALGSTVDGYIITTYAIVAEGPHAGAMTTEVRACTSTGAPFWKTPALAAGTGAGTFIGEHHGERAASGFVARLNAASGR
jgi:hypothetical protein